MIFEEFAAKSEEKKFNGKIPRSYFELAREYEKIIKKLDSSFIWDKALPSSDLEK